MVVISYRELKQFEVKMVVATEKRVLVDLSNRMADAVEKAANSVVMISGRARYASSGVVISADQILTANHTIEREEGIPIMLPNGSETNARVTGRDPGTDLALLRMSQPSGFPAEPATEEPRIGQLVLAVGRPSREGIEASQGIISVRGGPAQIGPNAMLDRYLRTDAIPYPGFSGGPLIDINGRVLGINTTGLASGAALTIPTDLALKIAAVLQREGKVTRGYLGVRTQPVEIPATIQSRLNRKQVRGLMIVSVERGSPAASGGLLLGDTILAVNGRPIEEHADLVAVLGVDMSGKSLPFEILRGGETRSLSVQIGRR